MANFADKRREALEAAMRDEVFRVARDILRSEGFATLTMERIASEVGVSRATIYNYFADAAEVLNFVEERVIAPLNAAAEDIAGGDASPADKLAALANTLFDKINQDRALARALHFRHETSGRKTEHKIRLRSGLRSIVRQVVADGAAHGEFRTVPPELVAELFLGTVGSVIETMLDSGEVRPAEEIVPALMDILLRGIQSTGQSGDRTTRRPS